LGRASHGDSLLKEAIGSLDRLLEHRVRLGVCVLLTRWERLSFSRLKELTGETDGSLGANLKKLEDDQYLAVAKEFVDRKPVTWYSITAKGRKALRAHLSALERLIGQAAGSSGRKR